MGAFLTSLLSVGNQYGEAKEAAQQEKLARAEKLRGLDVQDAYLQIARQREERESQAQKAALERGDLIKIGNRLWSVSKGKFVDTQTSDPLVALREFMTTLPSDVQKGAAARARMIAETDPNDPKAIIQEVMRYTDAAQAEQNRREDAAQRERERQGEQAESRKFREQEASESRRFREEQARESRSFQQQMVDYRLQEKSRYMTPQERQQWESIKALEPMVNRLSDFIEKNKLQGENNYVFGDRSALMQHLRMRGYKFGVAQQPITQELIKDAAAISIMGAAPWVRIGRGKYTLEQIQQHLPKATDTPANLYDKVTWLRDAVLTDAKEALAGLNPPGGSAPASPDDISNQLDPRVLLGPDVEQPPK